MKPKTFAGRQVPPPQPCTCSHERVCDRHWRKFNLSAFLRDRTEIGMRKGGKQ